MDTREDINDRHLRPILKDLLSQCTEPQKTQFGRAFGDVDELAPDRIHTAISLCERTIKKNNTQ